jgi:hypothetical protein
MEMIRTFRIIATEKNTHAVRDYKYTESYTVSGTTASVSYYDDEFTSLSYDTIDLEQFEIRAMPNKTSRKGVYYKVRPLPSIATLVPRVTLRYKPVVYNYIVIKIPYCKPYTTTLSYTKKIAPRLYVNIPYITPVSPNITVARS